MPLTEDSGIMTIDVCHTQKILLPLEIDCVLLNNKYFLIV